MDKFKRGDFISVLATGEVVGIRTDSIDGSVIYRVKFGNMFGEFTEDQLCEVDYGV